MCWFLELSGFCKNVNTNSNFKYIKHLMDKWLRHENVVISILKVGQRYLVLQTEYSRYGVATARIQQYVEKSKSDF